MSWKSERRAQREAAWAKEQAADAVERDRKDALPIWERIEEAPISNELKDILHRIAKGEREEDWRP